MKGKPLDHVLLLATVAKPTGDGPSPSSFTYAVEIWLPAGCVNQVWDATFNAGVRRCLPPNLWDAIVSEGDDRRLAFNKLLDMVQLEILIATLRRFFANSPDRPIRVEFGCTMLSIERWDTDLPNCYRVKLSAQGQDAELIELLKEYRDFNLAAAGAIDWVRGQGMHLLFPLIFSASGVLRLHRQLSHACPWLLTDGVSLTTLREQEALAHT